MSEDLNELGGTFVAKGGVGGSMEEMLISCFVFFDTEFMRALIAIVFASS